MVTTTNNNRFVNIFVREKPRTCKRLADVIDEYMYKTCNDESTYQTKKEGKIIRGFHPSRLYKSYHCPRKLVLEYVDAECEKGSRSFSAQEHRIFQNGHKVHERLQELFAEMSLQENTEIQLIGRWQCRKCGWLFENILSHPRICGSGVGDDICKSPYFKYREVPVEHKELRITGQADGIIDWKGERWLLEIKSMNPYIFKNLEGVPENYLSQAHLYMYILNIREMIFLVECKGTQALKEFHIKYNSKIINSILQALWVANKAIDEKKLPVPLYGEQVVKKLCRPCEFNQICKEVKKFGYNLKLQS